MIISTYLMVTKEGKRIRKATKVSFENGKEIHFMDKLTKKEVVKQFTPELLKSLQDSGCLAYAF